MKKCALTLSRLDDLSGALGLKQEGIFVALARIPPFLTLPRSLVTNVNDIKYRKYLTDLDLTNTIENIQSISIPPGLASCPVPTIIYSPKSESSDNGQDEALIDENYPSSMDELLSVYGSIDLSKLPGANNLMDVIDSSLLSNKYYKSMYENDEATFKLLMLQATVGRNYRQYFESRKKLEISKSEDRLKESENDVRKTDTTVIFQMAIAMLGTLNSIIKSTNCDVAVARNLFVNLMDIIMSIDPLSSTETTLPFVTRCLSSEINCLTSPQIRSYQAINTYNSAGYYVALGDKDGNRGKYYCGRIVTLEQSGLGPDSIEGCTCECGKEDYQCVECSEFVFINDASGRIMTPGTSGSYISSLYCGVTIPPEKDGSPLRPCSNGYQCPDCKVWQESMLERNKKTKFETTKPVLFDVSKVSTLDVLQSKHNQVKRSASPLVSILQDTAKRDFIIALQALCKQCVEDRNALADEALSLLLLLAISMKSVDLYYYVATVLNDTSNSVTLTTNCERFFFAVIDPGYAPSARIVPFSELVKSKRLLYVLLMQSLSSFILPGQFDFRNDAFISGDSYFLTQIICEVKGRISALSANSDKNDLDLLAYFVSIISASLLLLSVPQKSKEHPKLKVNDKVKRGPDWHYGDIDRTYSSSSIGIVTEVSRTTVTVSWGGCNSACYYDSTTGVYTVINASNTNENEFRDVKITNYIKSLDLKSIFLDIIFCCGSHVHLVELAIDALDINFKNIIVSTIDQIDVIGRFLDAIDSNNDKNVPNRYIYKVCDRLLTRVDELVLIEYCFATSSDKGSDHIFLFLQKLMNTLFHLSSPNAHQVQNVPEDTLDSIKKSLGKFIQMLSIMFAVNEITTVAFPLETGSAATSSSLPTFDISRINAVFQYFSSIVTSNISKILCALNSSNSAELTDESTLSAKDRFLAKLHQPEKNIFLFLFDKPNIIHLTTYIANTMKLLLLQCRSLVLVEDNSSGLLSIQKQVTNIIGEIAAFGVEMFISKSADYFCDQETKAEENVDDAPIEVTISKEVSGVRLRKYPTFDSDVDIPDGLTILNSNTSWKVLYIADQWAKIHPSEYARIISCTDTQSDCSIDFDPLTQGFIPSTSVDNIIIFKIMKSTIPVQVQLHQSFPINVRSAPEFVDATLFFPGIALLKGETYTFDCVNEGWASISSGEYATLGNSSHSPLYCTTHERESPFRPLVHVIKSLASAPHLTVITNPIKKFQKEIQNIYATITRCLLEYRVSVNSNASHWLTSSLLAIRIDDGDWDSTSGEKVMLLNSILDESTTSPGTINVYNVLKSNCKEQFQDRYYNPVTYASWAAIVWQTNLTDEVILLSTGKKDIPSVALMATWTSTNKVVRDALKQCDINDEKNGTKCFKQMCEDIQARAKLLLKFEPTNLASNDSKKYNSWLDTAFKAGLLKKTKSHIDKKMSEQRDRNTVSMSTVESTLDFLLNGPPTSVILRELDSRERAANIRISAFEQSISMFMSLSNQQRYQVSNDNDSIDGLNIVTPVDDERQDITFTTDEGLVSDIQRCLPLIVRRSFYDPSYTDGDNKAQTYNTHYLHSLGGLPKRLHHYLTEKHSEFIKVVLTQHLESPESPRERVRSGKASSTGHVNKNKDVFHVMSILALLSQDYVQDDVEFLREDKVIYYLNNCLKDEELLDENNQIFQIILKIFELISFRVCISKKLIHEREIEKDNHTSEGGNDAGNTSSQDDSSENVQPVTLPVSLLRRQPSLSDKAQDASEKILPNLVNTLFDLLFMFKNPESTPLGSADYIVTQPLKCSMKENGFVTPINTTAPPISLTHSFSTWVCVDKPNSYLHPVTKLRLVPDINAIVVADNLSAGRVPWSRIMLWATKDNKVVVSIYDPAGKTLGVPEHEFPSSNERSGLFYCKKCGNSGPSTYTGETRCIDCNVCVVCIKRSKSQVCSDHTSCISDDKYFSVYSNSKMVPYVWTHVAYTIDTKDLTLVLYINGIEESRALLPYTLLTSQVNSRIPSSEIIVDHEIVSKNSMNNFSNGSNDSNIEVVSIPYAYKYEIVADEAAAFSDVCVFYPGESFSCDPIASYSKGSFNNYGKTSGVNLCSEKKLVINNSFFQMKAKLSSRSSRNLFQPPGSGSYKFKVKAYTFNPAEYQGSYADLFSYRYTVGKGPECFNYTYADAYVAGARVDTTGCTSEQISKIKNKSSEFLIDNPSDFYSKCVSTLSSIHRIMDFLIQDRGVDALKIFFVGHSTYKLFTILLSLATKSFSTTIRAMATSLFNKLSALLPSSVQVEKLLYENMLINLPDFTERDDNSNVNHYLLSVVGSHFLAIVNNRVKSYIPEPNKFFVINQYVLFFRAIMKSYSCNAHTMQYQKFVTSFNRAVQNLLQEPSTSPGVQSSEWNMVLGMFVSLCGDNNVISFPGTKVSKINHTLIEDYTVICYDSSTDDGLLCINSNVSNTNSGDTGSTSSSYGVNNVKVIKYKDLNSSVHVIVDSPSSIVQDLLTSFNSHLLYTKVLAMTTYDERDYNLLELISEQPCLENEYESDHNYLRGDMYFNIYIPGMKTLEITFDERTSLLQDRYYDFIAIYRCKSDISNPLFKLTGALLEKYKPGVDKVPPLTVVNSKDLCLHFHSSDDRDKWGFKLKVRGIVEPMRKATPRLCDENLLSVRYMQSLLVDTIMNPIIFSKIPWSEVANYVPIIMKKLLLPIFSAKWIEVSGDSLVIAPSDKNIRKYGLRTTNHFGYDIVDTVSTSVLPVHNISSIIKTFNKSHPNFRFKEVRVIPETLDSLDERLKSLYSAVLVERNQVELENPLLLLNRLHLPEVYMKSKESSTKCIDLNKEVENAIDLGEPIQESGSVEVEEPNAPINEDFVRLVDQMYDIGDDEVLADIFLSATFSDVNSLPEERREHALEIRRENGMNDPSPDTLRSGGFGGLMPDIRLVNGNTMNPTFGAPFRAPQRLRATNNQQFPQSSITRNAFPSNGFSPPLGSPIGIQGIQGSMLSGIIQQAPPIFNDVPHRPPPAPSLGFQASLGSFGGAPNPGFGGAPVPRPPPFRGFADFANPTLADFANPPANNMFFNYTTPTLPVDTTTPTLPVDTTTPIPADVGNDSSDSDDNNDKSPMLPYKYSGKLHSCGKASLFYRPGITCNVCSQGGTISTYTCVTCDWDICDFCTDQEIKSMQGNENKRVNKKSWRSADHIRHRFTLLFKEFINSFDSSRENKINKVTGSAVASDADITDNTVDGSVFSESLIGESEKASVVGEMYEVFVKSKYHSLLCHIYDKWPRFQCIDPSFTKYIYISSRIAVLECNKGSGKLLKSIKKLLQKQLKQANTDNVNAVKRMIKDIVVGNLDVNAEGVVAGAYSYVSHRSDVAKKINTISTGHNYEPNENWIEKVFIMHAKDLELVFDKRCATANEASFLCVYQDINKQKLLAGPFYGSTTDGNWPLEKLILSNVNCLYISFESSDQVETDWGVRISVQCSSTEHVMDAQELLSTPSIEIALLFLDTLFSDAINGLKYNSASISNCSLLYILGDKYLRSIFTGFFQVVSNLQYYPAEVSKQASSIIQLIVILMKLYLKQVRGSSDDAIYHSWYDYVFVVFTAFTLFAKRCIVALESHGDTVRKHSFGQMYALVPDIQEIMDSLNRMRQSNTAPNAEAVSYYQSRIVLPAFDGNNLSAIMKAGENVLLGPIISHHLKVAFDQEYWIQVSPEYADKVKVAIGFSCTKDPNGFSPGRTDDIAYDDEVLYFCKNIARGDIISAILSPEPTTNLAETAMLKLRVSVNATEVYSTLVPLHSGINSKSSEVVPVFRRLKVFYPLSQDLVDSPSSNIIEDCFVQVAVAVSNNEIKVFNAHTGALVNTLDGHNAMVYSICFSPDGLYILSGAFDETFRIWDASDGRLLKVIEPLKDGNIDSSIDSFRPVIVEYNAAGTRIAAGVSYNCFLIYDVTNDYSLIKTVVDEVTPDITKHPFIISSFSPDGKLYAVGHSFEEGRANKIHYQSINYDDYSVKVWDVNTGTVLCTNEGEFWLTSVKFSHDSKRIAVGYVRESADDYDSGFTYGCVSVYSVNSAHNGGVAKPIFLTTEDTIIINTVEWSCDDQYIICGCNNGSVQIRNSSSGECVHTISSTNSDIRNICCTSKWVAVVYPQNPSIAIWNLSDFSHGTMGNVASSICESADNIYQLSGLAIFDYSTQKKAETLLGKIHDKVTSNTIELASVMPSTASSIHSTWSPISNSHALNDIETLYSDLNFDFIADLSIQKAYMSYILGHGDVCFDSVALFGKLCELRRVQAMTLDSSNHTREVSIPCAIGYFVKVQSRESSGTLRITQQFDLADSLHFGQTNYVVSIDLNTVAVDAEAASDCAFDKPFGYGNTNILNETFYNCKNIKIEAPPAHYLSIVNATYRSGDITAKIRECLSNNNTKLIVDSNKLKSILPMAAMLDMSGFFEPLYIKYEFISTEQNSKTVQNYQHDGLYYPGSSISISLLEATGEVALRIVPVYAQTTMMVNKEFEVDRDRFRNHFRFSTKAVNGIRDVILKYLKETKKTKLFNVTWETIKESMGTDDFNHIHNILSECGHSQHECQYHHPIYCSVISEQSAIAPSDCLALQGYVHVILSFMSHFFNNKIYDIIDMEDQIIDGSYLHMISQCRSYLIPSRLSVLCTSMLKNTPAIAKSNFTPEIEINRNEAVKRRGRSEADVDCKWSIFAQVFNVLNKIDGSSFHHDNRYFRVRLKNEEAYDAGGPFREIWSEIATDLMSSTLPLLVKTPNNSDNVGTNRHQFILNPEALKGPENNLVMNMYMFLGKLMGMAIRSELYLEISLASLIWKVLCDEEVTLDDYRDIAYNTIKSRIDDIRAFTDDELSGLQLPFTFTSPLSLNTNNEEIQLIEGGEDVMINLANREEYIRLSTQYMLDELKPCINAVKAGLTSVIPKSMLRLLTGKQLEDYVCGDAVINLEVLKKNTRYSGYRESDDLIKWFWSILTTEYNNDDIRQLIKFSWGRSRLPSSQDKYNFEIALMSCDDDKAIDGKLPVSHTCSFQIDLPRYSSREILKEKLTFAIYNCDVMMMG